MTDKKEVHITPYLVSWFTGTSMYSGCHETYGQHQMTAHQVKYNQDRNFFKKVVKEIKDWYAYQCELGNQKDADQKVEFYNQRKNCKHL